LQLGAETEASRRHLSALVLWVMAYPGIAQDVSIVRSLYNVTFAVGGLRYSVPLGLVIAGISVPSGFMKLLPKWLVAFGLLLRRAVS